MLAMFDSLSSLFNVETPAKFFVAMALIGCVAGVVTIIVVQLGSLASHQADLAFKRELVERGLSVDEIERIVSAKPISKARRSRGRFAEADAGASRG